MIEELTPQLLSAALLLVIVLSSGLTLIASVLVLWLYRRSVLRAMLATAGRGSASAVMPAVDEAAPTQDAAVAELNGAQQYRRALREPWRAAARYGLAGCAFALVMALAYCLVVPAMLTPARVALMVWGYAWPVVLALTLTGPAGLRPKATAVALYFAPLIVFTAFEGLVPRPAFDGDMTLLLVAITPPDIARAWVQGNVVPTLLFLLFLNRRERTVGPLLLGFITVITTGCIVMLLALATRDGVALLAALARATGAPVVWCLFGAIALAIVAFATVGWWLLRAVRHGYVDKTLNDRSLMLDALWLVFGSWDAMWAASAGLVWAAAAVLAFLVYKLAWLALWAAAPLPQHNGRGLVFLRVFALGGRSDRLFDALARHWRHVGSLQVITGPDVAQSTVQPHQLLDFLAGRLAEYFVADASAVAALMARRDTRPDRDGWFRINNFFCHADTWRGVLAALVRDGDVVLMDLRSFSPANAGCVYELNYLANHVPLGRCVLLIDASTDEPFVRQTLREAWPSLDAHSPNRAMQPDAVPLHVFGAGQAALRRLLAQLCAAA